MWHWLVAHQGILGRVLGFFMGHEEAIGKNVFVKVSWLKVDLSWTEANHSSPCWPIWVAMHCPFVFCWRGKKRRFVSLPFLKGKNVIFTHPLWRAPPYSTALFSLCLLSQWQEIQILVAVNYFSCEPATSLSINCYVNRYLTAVILRI